MKVKKVLIFVLVVFFSVQAKAQFGFGLDFNSTHFQLASEKYSNQSNTYGDLNVFYNFSRYGAQLDLKYLTQGCILNNDNIDIDFLQIPLYVTFFSNLDKKVNYQLLIGYHLKIPVNTYDNISENFYNHGISGKFLLNYKISEKLKCLSGIEFSEDLGTTYNNNKLLFKNHSIVFGIQILPFN